MNKNIVNNLRTIEDILSLSYFDALSLLHDTTIHCGGIKNTAELLFSANANEYSKIIEIGCGTGATTKALLRAGLDVTVVEPSSKLINSMLLTCKSCNLKVPEYFCSTVENMDMVCTDKYHIALLECVFGFVQDKVTALEQINRVLRKNGVIAITDFYYIESPPLEIRKSIQDILNLNQCLFKEDWYKYFKKFQLVDWRELGESSKTYSITFDSLKQMLNNYGIYNNLPGKDEGVKILENKFYEWNNVFNLNKKYVKAFNGIWKKTV